MIQDISPAVFDGAFHDYTPEDSTPIFCFWKNTVLLSCCNALPTYGQLRPFLTGTTYLFAIDQTAYYLGTLPDRLTLPGFTWLPHRTLRRLTPMSQTLAGFTAWHLAHWYQDNRFCGRCGQPMTPAAPEADLPCLRLPHLSSHQPLRHHRRPRQRPHLAVPIRQPTGDLVCAPGRIHRGGRDSGTMRGTGGTGGDWPAGKEHPLLRLPALGADGRVELSLYGRVGWL